MDRETGTYVATSAGGENVRAFVPVRLPPLNPRLDPHSYRGNAEAEQALERLKALTGLVASGEWLIYSAIRKEALLTSQIEGTQATLTDLLDEEAGIEVKDTDVSDVTNYLRAFEYVRSQLASENGLPLSTRLLCAAHKILMEGVRGNNKQPGELRTSQNWIGGSRPGNAVHVPPPHLEVPRLLGELEHYIHGSYEGSTDLPPLVRIALIHAQFETIHPFLDGNGRIGRLLIAALLEAWKILPEPLLYVSGQLKAYQAEYYRRLSNIRLTGDWESWIAFFLDCTRQAAESAQASIISIATLIANDRKKVMVTDGSTVQTIRLFENLPTMPRLTVDLATKVLGVTYPTAATAVKVLEKAGILTETSGKRRGQEYGYKGYIELLSR
ncbi:Fic family protein [Dyella nitratireducens]|uniref:Protein adenylyltransferase n=1 Tax=Dyella nitratireducens TaxID=1849580 RepID=A0ABQ1GEQ6_9GAMM|nr:Fic family protein [Dyella nitratireducens]GGA42335.1 adenosine monophosphate-protein transferase [Dyella nitratireducens]GLQ42016.1 adenosine monophosphate-protein transferase [Dyella nitratireducens]